jgi:para-aminobenzoate synthetase/4-amino-4-deoxychorismate lyase
VTCNRTPYVRLDTDVADAGNRQLLFEQPAGELRLEVGDDPRRFFEAIDNALDRGMWVAGYLTYEMGYLFEPRLRPLLENRKPAGPLAWVGIFNEPAVPDAIREKETAAGQPATVGELRLNISWDEYAGAFRRIKEFIGDGETYQVNYTMKARFNLDGSPVALYHHLRERQRVSYSAYIFDGKRSVISLSPELFLRREGQDLVTRPMKGTVRRGGNDAEDAELARWLAADPKNQAENVMIVDMVRNDLGRIAPPGGVRVSRLFEIEKYESLYQMTSTVEARIPENTSWYDIMCAMYPCASITGAPKIRTMELIADLEHGPRGVYTGAIGYFAPDGSACLNIAIRTIVVDGQGRGEMGIGSGVIYDSDLVSEFDECLLKAEFLSRPRPQFELLETMLLEDGQIYLFDRHMARLESSASRFGYDYCPEHVRSELDKLTQAHQRGSFKVRLLVSEDGSVSLSADELEPVAPEYRVKISSKRVSSSDELLLHKTTHRPLYTSERETALGQGFDEVLFVNERDEVTEGSISNVFVETGGVMVTPPVSSGILPGTFREELISTNMCVERVITVADLRSADRIFFGNSLRGLVPVRLEK